MMTRTTEIKDSNGIFVGIIDLLGSAFSKLIAECYIVLIVCFVPFKSDIFFFNYSRVFYVNLAFVIATEVFELIEVSTNIHLLIS